MFQWTISVPIIRVSHIYTSQKTVFNPECKPVGGIRCLLRLAFFWIGVSLRLLHPVPGPNECEGTILVKVAGVKHYHSSLIYYAVHISHCFIQDGNAAEIDLMFRFKTMFRHSRHFWLVQDVTRSSHLVSMDLPVCPT
jgi:hypothetical protein